MRNLVGVLWLQLTSVDVLEIAGDDRIPVQTLTDNIFDLRPSLLCVLYCHPL